MIYGTCPFWGPSRIANPSVWTQNLVFSSSFNYISGFSSVFHVFSVLVFFYIRWRKVHKFINALLSKKKLKDVLHVEEAKSVFMHSEAQVSTYSKCMCFENITTRTVCSGFLFLPLPFSVCDEEVTTQPNRTSLWNGWGLGQGHWSTPA